jgi:ABC-type Mn2+/Zn2+ transport system ATPase subunit
VLTEVDFRLPAGSRAALLGSNGSGKTTLLKTLAGLLPPLAGTARIGGIPAAPGNHRVAYLAQRPQVEWHFPVTVEGAVLAGRYVHLGWCRRPGAADREKVAHTLEQMRLGPFAGRPLHTLSGGQQQRVFLARALCQEAEVLLLDEPFTGLDSESCEIFETFLAGTTTLTVLMATHDKVNAISRFDAVLEIHDGTLESRTGL